VLLRSTKTSKLASDLMALAVGSAAQDARPPSSQGFHRLGPEMILPETIEPDRLYDVMMIAAPIFDRSGTCIYNLCIGPFPELLSGETILVHADRLLRACLQVMHADRAPL
jgi:hypothetical protein